MVMGKLFIMLLILADKYNIYDVEEYIFPNNYLTSWITEAVGLVAVENSVEPPGGIKQSKLN